MHNANLTKKGDETQWHRYETPAAASSRLKFRSNEIYNFNNFTVWNAEPKTYDIVWREMGLSNIILPCQ